MIYDQFPSKVLPVQLFLTDSAMAQAMAAIPPYTPMQETADCTVKVTGELREENTGMTAHWSDKLVFKNGVQELQD